MRRKPEPVSVSIHHRGEVQLAGNAEYKLAQAPRPPPRPKRGGRACAASRE